MALPERNFVQNLLPDPEWDLPEELVCRLEYDERPPEDEELLRELSVLTGSYTRLTTVLISRSEISRTDILLGTT